jgi:AcrR family transcriptional regulator
MTNHKGTHAGGAGAGEGGPEREDGRKAARRGAPPRGEASARERILATALSLFYSDGIRAIGVDTIVEKSGVSKTSLYRNFPSKDALIAAYAQAQNRRLWAWWDRIVARCPSHEPRAQLAAVLAGVARIASRPDFRGCPFINLVTEFPDPAHPGHVIAQANKQELRRRLTLFTVALGARDPERAAEQIALLINGAYASMRLAETAHLERDLVEAVTAICAS